MSPARIPSFPLVDVFVGIDLFPSAPTGFCTAEPVLRRLAVGRSAALVPEGA